MLPYSKEEIKNALLACLMWGNITGKMDDQTKNHVKNGYICLADFIAPKKTGIQDFIGTFAVSTGFGIDARVKAYEDAHDDYNGIILKALADRLAEAFAEHIHSRIRREFWGYAKDEILSNEELISEKYLGQQYDIHGGGIDLIFPHHDSEIAQMESVSGKKHGPDRKSGPGKKPTKRPEKS